MKLAEKYVTYYLVREGSRICFMDVDRHRIENLVELAGALKLTPRQLQEIFRTLGHMLETSSDKKGRLLWCLGVGSVAMAAFKIGAPDVFHSLGKQQLEPVDAMKFLKHTMGVSYPDWWFTLFFTGGGLKTKEGILRKMCLNVLG